MLVTGKVQMVEHGPGLGALHPWQQLNGLCLLSGYSSWNELDSGSGHPLLALLSSRGGIRMLFRARKMYSDKISKG